MIFSSCVFVMRPTNTAVSAYTLEITNSFILLYTLLIYSGKYNKKRRTMSHCPPFRMFQIYVLINSG